MSLKYNVITVYSGHHAKVSLKCSVCTHCMLCGCRHLTTNLGEVTEVDTHTKRFLVDHNVEDEEFESEVLQCLPSALPWCIPQVNIVFVCVCIYSMCT